MLPHAADELARTVAIGAEPAHEHYDAVLSILICSGRSAMRWPAWIRNARTASRLPRACGRRLRRVLERADRGGNEPPPAKRRCKDFIVAAAGPLRPVANHVHDLSERMAIEALFDEAQRTGKVIKNLSESDREIRRLHAEEVLRVPLHQLDHQAAELDGHALWQRGNRTIHPNRLITHLSSRATHRFPPPGTTPGGAVKERDLSRRSEQLKPSRWARPYASS